MSELTRDPSGTPVSPERPPALPDVDRLAFVDGARGIAATIVCLGHCVFFGGAALVVSDVWDADLSQVLVYLVSPGEYMVALFLMVSAFSLAYSEDCRRRQGRRTSVSVFWKRRAWRILPTYYSAFLIAVPGALIGRYVDVFDNLAPTFSGFLSHIFMVHNLRTEQWSFQVNRPLWTVAYEFQLYLVFPVAYRWARMSWVIPTLMAGFVLAGVHLGHAPEHLLLAYWFFLGLAVASGYRRIPAGLVRILGPVGLVGLVGAWLGVPSLGPFATTMLWSVAFVCLVIWMVRTPGATANPCVWRPIRWLGLRSYSLYAFHFPLLWLLYLLALWAGMSGSTVLWFTLVIGFPASIALAAVCFRWIEQPSLRRARAVSS